MLQRQQIIIKTSDGTLPFPFGSFLKASNPLHTSMYINDSKSKCQIWKASNNGLKCCMVCVFFSWVKNFFLLFIFICPINLPKFCKFPISNCTGCSVRLYSKNQWIVYSSLRRIWILLNLYHYLRLLKCFKLLIVLTTWMDPKTQAY